MSPRDTSNLTTTNDTYEMTDADRVQDREAVEGTQEDNLEIVTGAQDGDGEGADTVIREARAKPIQRSPQDDARLAIAARFSRGEPAPFDGDMTKPENLYGEVAREPAEEVDDGDSLVGSALEPEPAPVVQPKTRTLKVRGQDVVMTEDEILAAAQKTLAGDSYLEDARKLLEEAKTIKAERTGRDPQHPEGRSSTQNDDLNDGTGDPQHPVDDIEDLIESIQFKDPKEAAQKLRTVIASEAGKAAEQGHVERLFNNDLSRSQKALKTFTDSHPELKDDEVAAQVIEANLYKVYREDLVALGLDESKLPKSNKELANWHRLQRIHGFPVKDTTTALNEAHERMQKWRGTSTTAKPQAPRKEAPRVQVNVDRTERRAAIPNQPSRASLPPRQAPAPAKQTGSDVVNEMRRSRGQVVAT
jgi:hypothetical protein